MHPYRRLGQGRQPVSPLDGDDGVTRQHLIEERLEIPDIVAGQAVEVDVMHEPPSPVLLHQHERRAADVVRAAAGAADLARPPIGFARTEREGDDEEAIKRMFAPEFRNRLDAVIRFAALSPEVIVRVVDKFIIQLEEQLADRNVTIELSAAARTWLAEKGYDPTYGARPLARLIQEEVKKPLADELLFGKLAKGGRVQVGLKDGKLTFSFPAPDASGRKGGGGSGRRGGSGKRPRVPEYAS